MSVAKHCLNFSGLFEAEVLIELMLRIWKHPFASNKNFRHGLLENTAEALRAAVAGQKLMEDVPPKQMNFIAAVWYVEWNALANGSRDPKGKRNAWLNRIRRAIPSCFCDPDRLP